MRIIDPADVIEYEHAGDMLSRYQENKKKLFGPPPKLRLVAPPPPPTLPPVVTPPPTPILAAPPPPRPLSLPPPSPPRAFQVGPILHAVCSHFGVDKALLFNSGKRQRPLVRMRWVAMYLIKKRTSLSLPQIGRRLGGLDHTTILHGLRGINKLLQNGCQKTACTIAEIEARLDGVRNGTEAISGVE